MKVLIVEDDDAKRRLVSGHLISRLPEAQISEASSFRGAMDAIKRRSPDLILLDVTIPSIEKSTSDRDHTLVFGGRDVLRQLRRANVCAPVIVITAYERFDKGHESLSLEELEAQFAEVYPAWYVGAVSFSFRYDSWREDLSQLLDKALRMMPTSPESPTENE